MNPSILVFRVRVLVLLGLLGLGSLGFVASAGATRIVHRNAEELARAADRIFVGTCLSAQERRRGDLYFTEYVFSVEEPIKWRGRAASGRSGSRAASSGAPSSRTPAREVAAQERIVVAPERAIVRQLSAPPGGVVVGLPRYSPGERYLLMLHADSSEGLTSPVGFAQGAFRIFEQAAGRDDGGDQIDPIDPIDSDDRDGDDDPRPNGERRARLVAVNPLGNLGLFHRMSAEDDDAPRSSSRPSTRVEQALLDTPTGPVGADRLLGLVRELVAEPEG